MSLTRVYLLAKTIYRFRKQTYSACFQAENDLYKNSGTIPFQQLFKNFGEKPAFQEGEFSATFSPMFKESALVSEQKPNRNCGYGPVSIQPAV
jgi:hypothetical protein